MTVVEPLLRVIAALVLGDPAIGPAPVLVLGVLGLSAVTVALAVAVLVAAVLATVLGLVRTRSGVAVRPPVDLVTRIAWSHPDAEGHARPRAPGSVAPA